MVKGLISRVYIKNPQENTKFIYGGSTNCRTTTIYSQFYLAKPIWQIIFFNNFGKVKSQQFLGQQQQQQYTYSCAAWWGIGMQVLYVNCQKIPYFGAIYSYYITMFYILFMRYVFMLQLVKIPYSCRFNRLLLQYVFMI